jgi:AraC-like DNA-binding protein
MPTSSLRSAAVPLPMSGGDGNSVAMFAALAERAARHALRDEGADRPSRGDSGLASGKIGPVPELVPDLLGKRPPDSFFARPLDEDPVRTTVKMKREGCGAISLNITNFRTTQSERLLRIGSTELPPATTDRSWDRNPADRFDRLAAGREIAVEALGEFRREGEAMVFLIRFLERPADAPSQDRANVGLPKWRLKRVMAYIEANLEETISLAALANAAGLSPTYFAAQFKASTGLRPHDYVMRRRIESAQRQLLDPRLSVIEIAMSVGFQTQAHFTTTFKRIVGETPCRWRRTNYVDT